MVSLFYNLSLFIQLPDICIFKADKKGIKYTGRSDLTDNRKSLLAIDMLNDHRGKDALFEIIGFTNIIGL